MQPATALIAPVPLCWLWGYFLVLYLFFPALLAAIKHLWLPEDVRSQPCYTGQFGRKLNCAFHHDAGGSLQCD